MVRLMMVSIYPTALLSPKLTKIVSWVQKRRIAGISSVGAVGLEPTLLLRTRILSPVRLPIPPRPRGFGREYSS
jgi:hypothetical protein